MCYEYFKIIMNIKNSCQEHEAAHKHVNVDPSITSACKRDDASYGFIFAFLAVDSINIIEFECPTQTLETYMLAIMHSFTEAFPCMMEIVMVHPPIWNSVR